LISVGVDINAKDKDGNTALKLAQKAGNIKTVELLKSYGAKE
jgi:ankyrin repeat protein